MHLLTYAIVETDHFSTYFSAKEPHKIFKEWRRSGAQFAAAAGDRTRGKSKAKGLKAVKAALVLCEARPVLAIFT